MLGLNSLSPSDSVWDSSPWGGTTHNWVSGTSWWLSTEEEEKAFTFCLLAFVSCLWVHLLCWCFCHSGTPFPTSESSFFSLLTWTEDQYLYRNPPGLQCLTGTAEASNFMDWAGYQSLRKWVAVDEADGWGRAGHALLRLSRQGLPLCVGQILFFWHSNWPLSWHLEDVNTGPNAWSKNVWDFWGFHI